MSPPSPRPGPRAGAVTMRHIAQQARVSLGTVSHVMNGTAPVSEALRARVLEAVARLGYRPSELARGLRRNRSNLLGMLVPDITNPFFPAVVRGAEDVAYQNGYRLMLCNADNQVPKQRAYLRELHSYRMAGLMLIPASDSQDTSPAELRLDELPVVCLDRRPAYWKADSITVNNAEGALRATRHLIGLGHRRIATITGPRSLTSAQQRLDGFLRAFDAPGAPPRPDPEYIQEGAFHRLAGYERALILLRLQPRPTAIFAANDLIALGVMAALRELGLGCPDDVSLIGFDDLEVCEFTHPPLSTVAQPGYQMGAKAASMLLHRIQGWNGPTQTVVLDTELRVRASTAPPRAEPASRPRPSPPRRSRRGRPARAKAE